MDTPAGRVTARAFRKGGSVEKVSFTNVPSFLYRDAQTVDVPGIGPIRIDVAFGGAFYAYCDASAVGVGLKVEDYDRLIRAGRIIKETVKKSMPIEHPFEADLGFLYGTILIGSALDPAHHSRNVCIFAEGEVDRSPTGTGVSGRAAIHFARGELGMNEPISIESILGTTMTVRVLKQASSGPYEAVIPEVAGTAHIIGEHRFFFDPDDPLNGGFIFR
jgi:trans-L-3-hydroxyproline dehydratase